MKLKPVFLILFLFSTRLAAQQTQENPSVIDELSYGVVLDIPATKQITVKADVLYMGDANNGLHIDIYSPPGLKADEKRPAIIFLMGLGTIPGEGN